MEFSAKTIAELLNGTVEGNEQATISTLAKIEEAKPNSLTFLANPKYTEFIYDTGATIVIVATDFTAERAIPSGCTLIRVGNPYESFAVLLNHFQKMREPESGISDQASVHSSARIGEGSYVGPHTVIEAGAVIGRNCKIHPQVYIGHGVQIGDNCTIQPGTKVYDDCVLGSGCTIHAGVIIGADGFGFAPSSSSEFKKVAQIGNVIIGNNVEIGANTTIDRATLGSTKIANGVKLDNLIQIGHNVEIGENTVIAAQSGVAGSTRIGRHCMIGGQVGISGHLTIADEVKIAAQSGIGNSIKEKGAMVQGSPAIKAGEFKRAYVLFKKLPHLREQIRNLEKKINSAFESIER